MNTKSMVSETISSAPVMVYAVQELVDGDTASYFEVWGMYLRVEDAYSKLKKIIEKAPSIRWKETYSDVHVEETDSCYYIECPNEGYYFRADIQKYPLMDEEVLDKRILERCDHALRRQAR